MLFRSARARATNSTAPASRAGVTDFFEAPDFEINPDHPMIVRLEKIRHTDKPLAEQVAEQVFDNALVSAGLLEDPRAMLARLNSLLERVLT